MTTGAHGKRSRGKSHIICRRCGRHTYHLRKKACSSCGFGKSKRMRCYAWQTKTRAGKRKL